jgi:hypothetical protein
MVALMAKFVSSHRSPAMPRSSRNPSPNRPPDLSASHPSSDGIGVDASLGAVDRLYILGTRGRDGRGVYEKSVVVCNPIALHRLVGLGGVCMG